jgi:hypothetical protein
MFPFQFKRKQFLIRLSFAMSINKAQGDKLFLQSESFYLSLFSLMVSCM